MNNLEHKEGCPCSCSECYLLGDKVPDWPRKKECRKLDEKLRMMMEDEGSPPLEIQKDASNT